MNENNIDKVYTFLKKHPVFHDLSDEDIVMFTGLIRVREIGPQTVVLKENEPSDGLYVIREGKVRVMKECPIHKDSVPIIDLEPGDIFGEFSLLENIPATATVMASEKTILWWLPSEDFHALVHRETPMAFRLWRLITHNLIQKLVRTTTIIHQLYEVNRCLCEDERFREFYRMWNYE